MLRRLRRLCARAYGVEPLFVMTSATVANPRQHARALLGLQPAGGNGNGNGAGAGDDGGDEGDDGLDVVADDGSPAGARLFALWNPPLTSDARAARQAGGAAPTRTQARATLGSSYRARRQRMRLELREANAARRRGVSVVRGLSQAQWEAAVRLATGKRVLAQCLFDFRYGGDRPESLDPPPPAEAADAGSADAAAAAAAAPAGAAANACDGGGGGVLDELFDVLRAVGVDVKAEPRESSPEQQQQQQEEDQGQEEDGGDAEGDRGVREGEAFEEAAALREAMLGDADGAGAGGSSGGPATAAIVPSAPLAGAAARGPDPPQPPAASVRTPAEAARRAALAKMAEAALSAVREVPGGAAPPPSASLTGEAELRAAQGRVLREAAAAAAAAAATAPPPDARDAAAEALSADAAEDAGGSGAAAAASFFGDGRSGGAAGALTPEVRREIELCLPRRGAVRELHGAAGTATEHRRESPIVEVRWGEAGQSLKLSYLIARRIKPHMHTPNHNNQTHHTN